MVLDPSTTTRTPEPAVAAGAEPDPRALRLVSVLAAGLPADLGTEREPARYTVPAVFSRQVTPAERARIEDPGTAHRLAERAHVPDGLHLAVSDRRLLVGGTNLAEMKAGLATELSAMLRTLGDELLGEQDRRAALADERRAGERDRVAAVAAAAAEVRFD
ncbi:hypothetical protein [Cellulomonas sp.]|uniref:hypothetical protein n=1 Tax=Cellulomonas sp. TaxID=40001 RepID=UPI002811ABD6|nr:hypothetical protein [Cellulomonas sp.]